MRIEGRCHILGDDINTDYIVNSRVKVSTNDVREMADEAFADIDPDMAGRIEPGDLIVAGNNFGCGSSRETAARVIQALGVSAVIASSFARIFFRNGINVGLPLVVCDTTAIADGDYLEVRMEDGVVVDHTAGIALETPPLPGLMQAILVAGGVKAYIAERGDLAL